MPKTLEVQDVIAHALHESGLEHTADEVADWLDGDTNTMPPDVGPVIESILQNLPYHVRVIQARLLADPEITRTSLHSIATIPKTERKSRIARRQKVRAGEQCFYGAQRMYLSPRATKAIKALANAMGISQGALVELWLESAIQNLLKETEHLTGLEPPTATKIRQSKLPEPAIRHTIKDLLHAERISTLD